MDLVLGDFTQYRLETECSLFEISFAKVFNILLFYLVSNTLEDGELEEEEGLLPVPPIWSFKSLILICAVFDTISLWNRFYGHFKLV